MSPSGKLARLPVATCNVEPELATSVPDARPGGTASAARRCSSRRALFIFLRVWRDIQATVVAASCEYLASILGLSLGLMLDGSIS